MTISIHQPNFFPWYPYFYKIINSDIFVVLENCQFEKNSYTNRFIYNKIWNTMSVTNKTDLIVNKKYQAFKFDWEKIKRRFKHCKINLSEYDDLINESLSDTNTNIIKSICAKLDIRTKIVSDFKTKKRGTDRILEICNYFEADSYLTNKVRTNNYIQKSKFNDVNLKYIECSSEYKIPIIEYLKKYT